MKGIVIGHKNGGVFVMDQTGSFHFVRKNIRNIGSEIELKSNATKYTILATCSALLFIGSGWLWHTESHTIFNNINTCIELVYNSFVSAK